jgi:RNA polymerase sigma-70 factor (ECF subfamily)
MATRPDAADESIAGDGARRLAERFEADRPRLRAVAYRMLGSLSEAEDAVQDAWLRASQADIGGVRNLTAWLTTVVTRVCLNQLRARRTRGEEPLDALPDGASGPGAPGVRAPPPRRVTEATPSGRPCWPTRSESPCWWSRTR